MNLSEKLLSAFEQLPEASKNEVINFVEYMKAKEDKRMESLINEIVDDNIEAFKELGK